MTWLQNSIQIGRFSAPLWMLAAGAGLLASYTVSRIHFRADKETHRRVFDVFFNAFLIFLIVWKLSPALFQLRQVVRQPLSLLYLPGGIAGSAAGVAGALSYVAICTVRLRPLPPGYIRGVSFSAIAMIVTFLIAGSLVGQAIVPAQSHSNAPEFELAGLDGDTYRLSDFRGRYVILNFWASWCGPCRAEIPEIVDYHQSLDDSGPVILSINQTASERNVEAVRDFVEDNRIEFPVLLDTSNRVHGLYGIRGIPTTYVIGPDGGIDHRRTGAITKSWLRGTTRGAD